MEDNKIQKFYLETSPYTDLGLYKDFAQKLPSDIKELCLLQRMQIIHPTVFKRQEIRNSKDCFWGDMTQITDTSLLREDDIVPTSIGMLAELLRKDSKYSLKRDAKNKLFVTCRGQALLLASTLKAKGIPARVRSGFAEYINGDGIYLDHWITEYYNKKQNRWILVDADCCCNDNIEFDIYDIPRDKFFMASQIWIDFRKNKLDSSKLGHAYYGMGSEKIIENLVTALIYDFHCLMNDEIIYLHCPKYFREKNFQLSDKELEEFDELAELMLDPNRNFEFLKKIWDTNSKFRIMSGGTITS